MGENAYDIHMVRGRPNTLTKQMVLEAEALRAGLTTVRRSPGSFDASSGGRTVSWTGSVSSLLGATARATCQDKALTRDRLAASGIPIAEGRAFEPSDLSAAGQYALRLGWPVVVKPVGGIKGIGITSGIETEDALMRALRTASLSKFGATGLLIERHVPGNDHRVLATPTRTLSVVRRDAASVLGDGTHTVEELVDIRNSARRRNPYLGRKPNLLRLDDDAVHLLASQGHTTDSVPASGTRVTLSPTANLSRGGDSTEVMPRAHPSVLELGAMAVSAIDGLPIAGVNIMLEDSRKAIHDQYAHVIEINHNPALMMHPFPMFGTPRNVFRDAVRDAALAAGMPVQPPEDILTVRTSLFGLVQGVYLRKWIRRHARRLDLDGWVANSPQGNRVDTVVRGPAERIAMLIRRCLRGPDGAVVQEIRSRRDDTATIEPGFSVLRQSHRRSNL